MAIAAKDAARCSASFEHSSSSSSFSLVSSVVSSAVSSAVSPAVSSTSAVSSASSSSSSAVSSSHSPDHKAGASRSVSSLCSLCLPTYSLWLFSCSGCSRVRCGLHCGHTRSFGRQNCAVHGGVAKLPHLRYIHPSSSRVRGSDCVVFSHVCVHVSRRSDVGAGREYRAPSRTQSLLRQK